MRSKNIPTCLCSNTDVHTVASLLKLYLRELPEPVIPYAKYEDFLSCAKLLSKEEDAVSQYIDFQRAFLEFLSAS